jgi:hypothetical protein
VTLLKSIAVCLVLANVGYFLWARGIAKPPEAPPPVAPAATLKLASESTETAHAASPEAGSGPGGITGAAGIAGVGGGTDASRADSGDGAKLGLLTNVKRCISVGPFRDVAEAAHAATTLRGGGSNSG